MRRTRNRGIRWIRRAGMGLGMATLFQIGACQDFVGYTLGSVANGLPSATYQTLFGLSLLPAQIGLSLATGGTGGLGGSSGSSGTGLGGIGGTGGITNPVSTGGIGGLGTGGI